MSERRKPAHPNAVRAALRRAAANAAKHAKQAKQGATHGKGLTGRAARRAARQCQGTKKDGQRCTVIVEPWRPLVDGKRLCHVHHPEGDFQVRVRERRAASAKRRRDREAAAAALKAAGVSRPPATAADRRRAAEARESFAQRLMAEARASAPPSQAP